MSWSRHTESNKKWNVSDCSIHLKSRTIKMIIQNVKIINVSNRTFFVTILACMLLLYFFYLFNSCLLSSFHKAFRRVSWWKFHFASLRNKNGLKIIFLLQSTSVSFVNTSTPSSQSDDTQIIFGSVVRIVSLTDDDSRNESSFKYRLVNPQNLSARRLPDVLLIGVKKSGTRALLEFVRVHPDGEF